MKKILTLLLIIILSFPIFLINHVHADTINDEKVAIEIIKDNNTIEIKHTSGKQLDYAVVEYSFYDTSNNYISMLDQFKITNNKFTINKGVSTVAVKVHQVKELVNNSVYYTYMTTNKNTVGSFAGVQRKAIVEIETTHVKTVNVDFQTSESPKIKKYYEFYFDFKKNHDELVRVDIDYVLIQKNLWGLITKEHNMTDSRKNTDRIKKYVKNPGWINTLPVTHFYIAENTNIKALEVNNTSNPGTHVLRVQPKGNDTNLKLHTNAHVKNLAIIEVEYTLDGEFYIEQVINNPTTPIDDTLNQLEKIVEQFKTIFDNFNNFINNITSFFNGNSSTILKVVLVVIALILLGPILFVIKWLFIVIKLILKIPVNIFKTLKVLFVPKKKYKFDERGRYR